MKTARWNRLRDALFAAPLLGALAASAPAQGAPAVVASIKPVHSLVAGVMVGVAEPELLVQGAGSPHAYSLRPSQALALRQADVVFWVGAGMESFLEKPLQALAHEARVIALAHAPKIELLEARAGGAWQAHGHRDERPPEAGAGHDGEAHAEGGRGGYDLHLWLDPRNAESIVDTAVAVLSEVDPANAARYQHNGAVMMARLEALDAELAAELRPVSSVPYVVFHDAYQYLERRYGLNAVGSMAVTPDRAPGARRLYEIRRTIRDVQVVCVFSEPQFEPALVETVLRGTSARHARLDPLGADLPAGPDAYFTLMRALAQSLSMCLRQGADPSARTPQ